MGEISQFKFSYSGHAPFLFQSVTETLTDGSWTSITGESGSGKSTLIRLMLGLLKPSAGSIRVPRGTRIGFVPQASDYAYSDFPITLLEAPTIYERLRTRTEAFSRLSGSEKRIFGTPLFSRSNQLTSAIGRRRLSVRFQGAK